MYNKYITGSNLNVYLIKLIDNYVEFSNSKINLSSRRLPHLNWKRTWQTSYFGKASK